MGASDVARGAQQLRTVGLGSCLAVTIFAPRQQLAALAHCMLPTREAPDGEVAKYVDTAVPSLIAALKMAGGTQPLSAVLVGGASMFPGVSHEFMRDIAGRNVEVALQALDAAGVPVRAQDVGGHVGRSIQVDPVAQRVLVSTIRGGSRWL